MNDPSRGNNEGMQMKIYGKCVFQLCLKTCVYIYMYTKKYIYISLSLSNDMGPVGQVYQHIYIDTLFICIKTRLVKELIIWKYLPRRFG